MTDHNAAYKTISTYLVRLGLTDAAQKAILDAIDNAEKIPDYVDDFDVENEVDMDDLVEEDIDNNSGISVDDNSGSEDVDEFEVDIVLSNDADIESDTELDTNPDFEADIDRIGVFHITVRHSGMIFTLLKEVPGVHFIVWRGEREDEVEVGESVLTINHGSEGIIIDGGTRANSFYMTSTCFRFSPEISEGVYGNLTADNLLEGPIVDHVQLADRNAHPTEGYRNDMFPADDE